MLKTPSLRARHWPRRPYDRERAQLKARNELQEQPLSLLRSRGEAGPVDVDTVLTSLATRIQTNEHHCWHLMAVEKGGTPDRPQLPQLELQLRGAHLDVITVPIGATPGPDNNATSERKDASSRSATRKSVSSTSPLPCDTCGVFPSCNI